MQSHCLIFWLFSLVARFPSHFLVSFCTRDRSLHSNPRIAALAMSSQNDCDGQPSMTWERPVKISGKLVLSGRRGGWNTLPGCRERNWETLRVVTCHVISDVCRLWFNQRTAIGVHAVPTLCTLSATRPPLRNMHLSASRRLFANKGHSSCALAIGWRRTVHGNVQKHRQKKGTRKHVPVWARCSSGQCGRR